MKQREGMGERHHSPFHASHPISNHIVDFHNDSDHFSFLPPYLWVEPSQYHWDWTISDPLAGEAATPSYARLPQATETPVELPQTSWVSQIPRDQETVGLPGP